MSRLQALEEDVAAIAESVEGSNGDDEHDPEGATIAFERQRTASLRDRARVRLEEIDAALLVLLAGAYGRCISCGTSIAPERLLALPATQHCVDCSRLGREARA